MRLHYRKFLAVACVLIVIWLIVAYSSVVEAPKSKWNRQNILDIEKQIDHLRVQMDSEFLESNLLLEKVRKHLDKPENVKKEDKEVEYVQNVGPVLPVLVIACDRVTVRRCLDNLVKFRPNKETFPIIVSQDCGHNATYQVIKSFVDADPSIAVVQQPDLSEIFLDKAKIKFRGYYKIARHYRFALNHVFKTLGHEAVIIVEDDLDISPDFFEYFQGTYPLLQKDPSIWCISAWNDNGKKDLIDMSHPEQLYRTDFFPGLGWLLRRDSWVELEPNWPPGFFDDWLRNPENTGGRACIRPEISRTYSFGKVGVSKGLFFDMHLRHMQLNMEYVEFTKLNVSYLLKETYDDSLTSVAYAAPEMSAEDVVSRAPGAGEPVRVSYRNAKSFQKAAKKLGLMDDFRSGIPRTAYLGIVSCFIRGRRVYLAPDFTWVKYDPNWG